MGLYSRLRDRSVQRREDSHLGGQLTFRRTMAPARSMRRASPRRSRRTIFAEKYKLEIRLAILRMTNDSGRNHGGAVVCRSSRMKGCRLTGGPYSGLSCADAIQKLSALAEEKGFGKATVTYRLKDWGISRQRYWGTPIPMLYCEKDGIVPVPEKDLPVILPENVDITLTGGSPLGRVPEFVNATCPKCGGPARRETDTMDTFVDSSWYFYRYTDAHNDHAPFDGKVAAILVPDRSVHWRHRTRDFAPDLLALLDQVHARPGHDRQRRAG